MKHLDFKRPIETFSNGDEFIAYLLKTKVVLLRSLLDVNLGTESGFYLKDRITSDKELHNRSVPFIFWSTTTSEKQIHKAYDRAAQGFFIKPNSFEALCEMFRKMTEYWQESKHPKAIIK